jgi:hypothetical protein
MRIGLFTGSELFLDWSLIKYSFTMFPNTSSYACCLLFLSYFPAETRFLNDIFNVISIRQDFNFQQRLLIYQVYRVKELRQTSSSLELNNKFLQLNNWIKIYIKLWFHFGLLFIKIFPFYGKYMS